LIQKLPLDGAVDRFEATLTPHCHLICERCGSVRDFDLPYPGDIDRQVESSGDFKVHRHRIDFYGVCMQCQSTVIP